MPERSPESERRRVWEIVWLIVVAASLGFALGDHALIDPDEGRNAAIAREMAASGDFLIPHLNGLPFLDKPPLYFAVEALALRLLGNSELAIRLPSLLLSWATIALAAWFAAHLLGRRSAWIAATACATAPLAIALARVGIFDSMLSFFMVLAIVALYRAVELEAATAGFRGWRWWTLLGWASMALGVLTKGPVALLVPLLVSAPYALWRRQTRAVWHWCGPLLFLLGLLPWAAYVELRVPGFLRYALVTETWGRMTTDELQRTGPAWYFLPFLLAGCFPWLVLAVAGWHRLRQDRGRTPETAPGPNGAPVLLALWIVLPLLLFSLSQSKRPQYILPLVPAVALLAAAAWNGETAPRRAVRLAASIWMAMGVVFLAVPHTRAWLRLEDELAQTGSLPLAVLGGVAIACGALAWWHAERRRLAPALLALPALALVVLTAPAMAQVARARSTAELAAAVRPHLTADTRVVAVDLFEPSLLFYLERPLVVSAADTGLLTSNSIAHFHRDPATAGSTLRPAGWWRQALADCAQPSIFVVRQRQRALLSAAGLPELYAGPRLFAFGPCASQNGGA